MTFKRLYQDFYNKTCLARMFIMVILGYFMNEQNVIPEQWLGATGNVGRLQKKLKV